MPIRLFVIFLCLVAGSQGAQDGASSSSASAPRSENQANPSIPQSSSTIPAATDPSYKLSEGDSVYIMIGTRSNPVETSTTATIAKTGDVRLPWIEEEIVLKGKTVRDAERYLEALYRDKKILNAPVITVKVSGYFPREVTVLGAVRSPGSVGFPPDTVGWDIADVISKVGGFSPVAKPKQVTVTHRDETGKESMETVDLEDLFTTRRKAGKGRAEYLVYPGDRIWVPESLF